MKFKRCKPSADWFTHEWHATQGQWRLEVIRTKYGEVMWAVYYRERCYASSDSRNNRNHPTWFGDVYEAKMHTRKLWTTIQRSFATDPPHPFEKALYLHMLKRENEHAEADPRSPNFLIVDSSKFPIRPEHIVCKEHLWNAFGNNETEISAYWLLKMATRRGNWDPFTIEDVEAVYGEVYKDGFTFNSLIGQGIGYSIRTGHYDVGGGWIYHDTNTRYYFFTHDFVMRCFMSACATMDLSVVRTFDDLWHRRWSDPTQVGCVPFDSKLKCMAEQASFFDYMRLAKELAKRIGMPFYTAVQRKDPGVITVEEIQVSHDILKTTGML